MPLNKTELISQIVQNAAAKGLSKDKQEQLKKELASKSLSELSGMISNSNPKSIGFKNFVEFSKGDGRNVGNIWGGGFNPKNIEEPFGLIKTIPTQPKELKKLTPQEEKEAVAFSQSYLFDAVKSAVNIHNNYVSDEGIVDELWQSMKYLVDKFDISSNGRTITTLDEVAYDLNKEYASSQKLQKINKKGAFEFAFKKERGVKFDAVKVKDFEKKSSEYLTIVAHKEKHESLLNGITEIKSIMRAEQEYKQALKYTKGPAAGSLRPPKLSSTQKFGEVFMQYCNGDKKLFEQFKDDFFKDLDTPEKINKSMPKLLDVLAMKSKNLYESQLDGKSFADYQSSYETAYKDTFGGANPKDMTKGWVETQKQGAGFVKMGIVVASTVMLGGSNFLAQGGARLAQNVGARAAGQIVKLGMTTTGVATGVGLDYANALTSETGLTKEKNAEILLTAKNAIPYAFFGAYVSGPVGEKLVNALKGSGSTVMPKILDKAFAGGTQTVGFTAEVSLDAMFELMISEGDLMSVLQGNATGEVNARAMNKLMTMIAGGKAHGAAKTVMRNAGLEGYKVEEKIDVLSGKKEYTLYSPKGEAYMAESAEALLAGVMAKAVQSETEAQSKILAEPLKAEKTKVEQPKPEPIDVMPEKLNPLPEEPKVVQTKTKNIDNVKEKISEEAADEKISSSVEKGYCRELVINACKIGDNVDAQILDIAIKILEKDKNQWSVMDSRLKPFKNKDGYDAVAYEKYNELIEKGFNENDAGSAIIACKDDYFDNQAYTKLLELHQRTKSREARYTIEKCKVEGDKFSLDLYNKVEELLNKGYELYDVHSIMSICRIEEGSWNDKKYLGFSQDAFSKFQELRDTYKVEVKSIPKIIGHCMSKSEVLPKHYDAAIKLKQAGIEDDYISHFLYSSEFKNFSEFINKTIEFNNETKISPNDLYQIASSAINESNKVRTFDNQAFIKAKDLYTTHKMNASAVHHLVEKCKDIEFSDNLYNHALKLKEIGVEDKRIPGLVNDCLLSTKDAEGKTNYHISSDVMNTQIKWKKLGLSDEVTHNLIDSFRSWNILTKDNLDYVEKFSVAGVKGENLLNLIFSSLDRNNHKINSDALAEILSIKQKGLEDDDVSALVNQCSKDLHGEIIPESFNAAKKLVDNGMKSGFNVLRLIKDGKNEIVPEKLDLIIEAKKGGVEDKDLYSIVQRSDLDEKAPDGTSVIDKKVFHRLVEISALKQDDNFISEVSQIIKNHDVATQHIIDALKSGIKPEQILEFKKKCEKSYNEPNTDILDKTLKALMAEPDKYQKIVSVIYDSKYYGTINSKALDLCLNHLDDNLKPLLYACQNGGGFVDVKLDLAKKIAGSDPDKAYLAEIIDATYPRGATNIKPLSDEMLSKINDLIEVFPEKLPNFIKSIYLEDKLSIEIVDKVIKLIKEDKVPAEELNQIGYILKNKNGEYYTNYDDVIKAHLDNKEAKELIYLLRGDDPKYDLEGFNTMVDIVEKGLTPRCVRGFIDKSQSNKSESINKLNDLVNSVDMSKYSTELHALVSRLDYDPYNSYSDFFNIKLNKEELNFMLETQQIIDKAGLNYIIGNKNYKVFKGASPEFMSLARDMITESANKSQITDFENLNYLKEHLNEHPESLTNAKKFKELMPRLYSVSHNRLVDNLEILNDDAIAYIIEKSKNNGFSEKCSNVIDLIAKKPSMIDTLNNYKLEHQREYGDLDTAIGNFTENLPLFELFCKAKNEYGNNLFTLSELSKNNAKILGDIKDMEFLCNMKSKEGSRPFSLAKISDILLQNPKELKALLDNTPTEKELNANTLYERTFNLMQDKVAQFGCSSFADFESKVPTFTGKDRAAAGKLLGEIKKQTIDTFTQGLPPEYVAYLGSDSGVFSAKDLDNAVRKFNENPALRKILADIEKTGTADFSKIEKLNLFIDFLTTGDINIIKTFDTYKIEAKVSDNPLKVKAIYAETEKLYDIYINKMDGYIKNAHPDLYTKHNGDIEQILREETDETKAERFTKIILAQEFIGMSNISALIHNESPIKSMQYINIAKNLNVSDDDQKLISDVLKSPGIKDNDFKKLLTIVHTLQNDNIEILKKMFKNALETKKIDPDEMVLGLYKLIAQDANLKTDNITKTDLNGWDLEYMPFILNTMKDLSDKNKDLLKGLLKNNAEGKYKESLFDPNTPNGKLNIETKEIYESKNLDFDKFLNYEPEVKFNFTPKEVSIQPILKSALEDLHMLSTKPEIKPLLDKFLSESKYAFDKEQGITHNGQHIGRETIHSFISKMNKFISENQKLLNTSGLGDIKDHFVQRKRALGKQIGIREPEDVTISLWKRNIKHDIFQGHYCQCCVSLDGINKHSIIQSLSHTVDQIAELKNAKGETVGKVKMLFIEDTKTGEPALLANGFEIISPYNFDNGIRETFIEFMKGYSKSVAGKEIPIYTGVTYQKINFDDFPDIDGNFQLLGKTPDNTYHLDSYSHSHEAGSHPKDLDKPKDLKLKVMYKP